MRWLAAIALSMCLYAGQARLHGLAAGAYHECLRVAAAEQTAVGRLLRSARDSGCQLAGLPSALWSFVTLDGEDWLMQKLAGSVTE